MKLEIPKKKSKIYTEPFSMKVDAELKHLMKKIDSEGTEVAELIRKILRAELPKYTESSSS